MMPRVPPLNSKFAIPTSCPCPTANFPQTNIAARVYLASLASGSRPTIRGSLQVISELLTGRRCTWETMPWHLLRVQHTQALRA